MAARRRTIADWTAGVLAFTVLVLGALVVIKPALDHWDELYRANPFTTGQENASFAEEVLGNSGILFLRIILVALGALLMAIVAQRVILGELTTRIGRGAAVAAPTVSPTPRPLRSPDMSVTGATPARNGVETPDLSTSNLAPAIAKLVSSRREELGLSQRELAKRAGISHTVISRIESGEHSPSRKTLERLADALLVVE